MALDEEEENHNPSQVCWRNLCDDDDRTKVITDFPCERVLERFEVVPCLAGQKLVSETC